VSHFYYSLRGSIVLILLILLNISPILSQTKALQFEHYTIEQGLAQNSAFCILQDRMGFIWVGTEQGLNRFDGYDFKVYKFQYNNPNSLSNSYVNSIYEDAAGVFWIGTNGGGLNRFEPRTQNFIHFYVDPESIDSQSNIVNVVYEDNSHQLWVGTEGGGLFNFDRRNRIFSPVWVMKDDGHDRLGHRTVNTILEDRNGTLWVGTGSGLKKLNRDKQQLETVTLEDHQVLSLYEDNKKLWIGTDNGFYIYTSPAEELIHYLIPSSDINFARANRINVFYPDRMGVFWIGCEYGLYIFNRKEKTFNSYYAEHDNPNGLSGNRISTIFEDRSGALWIGLDAGGLLKLKRREQNFFSYTSEPDKIGGILFPSVFAIYKDKDKILWLGTYGEGLIAFDRKKNVFINYRHQPENPSSLSSNNIWAICEDRTGMLWIGTAGNGLNRFSRKTGKFTRFRNQPQNQNSLSNNYVSSIIEDKKGNLWIATNGGLDKLNPQRSQFTHYYSQPNQKNTLAHNNVYILLQDRENMCWIGTKGGLSRFDPNSDTFTTYRINPNNPNSLLQPIIFSLCEDRHGNLWIGTTGGLHKLNKESGTFSLYTEKDGLPNDVINGILEDDHGFLWLSTNKGISKFNPRSGKFKNYGKEDGLQSYEFSGGAYYKSPDGELFFGGVNGFNSFFPEKIKDNPYIPPVVITDFKIFNREVPIGSEVKGRVILNKSIAYAHEITLNYLHHTFSFEFAALSYIYSEKNEYAYMMEGVDSNWNYVGQRRFVAYANLAPGDYIFRVKASNNNGVWNEKGVSLNISVLPPFWQTWWFNTFIVILIVLLVLMILWIRTRLILKRTYELEDMVTKRTAALRESEEKYRTLVERAHSGIIVVQNREIVFMNNQFAKLVGYESDEHHGSILLEIMPPKEKERLERILAKSETEEQVTGNFTTPICHKDGPCIDVEISYGKIRYNKQPALLMFFNDIRMQKLLEEERMKTAKLESTRILAGGIAHDFNNLLTIIMGNIELALAEINPQDSLFKALSDAEMSGLKAVDLIQRFLTISKGYTPCKKVQPLQDIVREAVNTVLQGSTIDLILKLPDDLLPVNCDSQQIKQCIENIVINAKQAMQAPGVLEITGENNFLTEDQIPTKAAGKYVCISIKDNGIGIPKSDLPKIFDPYFSTREDVTQKGLGLGLAVVQSIISKHEGAIRVESESNVGTSVRICLPAVE